MHRVCFLVHVILATQSLLPVAALGDGRQGLRRDDPQKTIQDFPRLTPTDEYKSGMRGIKNGASKDEYHELKEKYSELKEKKGEEEGKEGGEEEGEEGDHAGHVFASGMVATAVILSVTFGLANSENKQVSGLTWGAIDNVVAIFLAVVWYQAFDELLSFGSFQEHHEVLAGIIHAIVVLALACYLAWVLRVKGGKVGLAVFCACVAHYVSFSSMHAATESQDKHFNHNPPGPISREWMLAGGLVVLLLGLAALAAVIYQIKKKKGMLEEDEWDEKVTDVENDFGAMGFSVAWSLFVRFLIAGSYHKLEGEVGEDGPVTTHKQRMAMLAYGVVMVVVAFFSIKGMNALKSNHNSYTMKRVLMFGTSFFSMSVAWALLLWGEWEFIDNTYYGSPITGRLFFAVLCSFFAAMGILSLAHLLPPTSHESVEHSRKVALVALSLAVGWSWELCFDSALESLVEGSTHPVVYKVSLALVLGAVIIPVYVRFLKPTAMEKAEAAGLE